MGDNAGQVADWNGIVGQRWAELQTDLDRLISAYGEAALKAAAPKTGEHIIDVGCGCGDTSLSMARSVGERGSVLGVDISAVMLEVARQRALQAGLTHLELREADAASAVLPRYQDLIFSRFGVMFFDDPVAAFRNLRGALRSGGRMAFCCWRSLDENPWALIPIRAVRQTLAVDPPAPVPNAPGSFAFASTERIREILDGAGFAQVKATAFDAPAYLGANVDAALENAVKVGPAARMLREMPAASLPVAREAIRREFQALDHGNGIAPGGAVWIVTATNPAQ